MEELNPMEWALLPLKKYAVFAGRAPRAEYWWFYLGTVVAGFVMGILDGLSHSSIFQTIVNLGLIIPSLAVAVRRLHDINRSGWWLFALIVPIVVVVIFAAASIPGGTAALLNSGAVLIVGAVAFVIAAIILFVFMVTPGTEGPNRYGPDPYGPDDLEEVFA